MDTKKGKLTTKVQASTVLFILIASSLFVAAPAFMPKAAAAVTGTITLSHAKLFGNSTLRIVVADSDINANNAPAPDVKLTNTTSAGVSGVPRKLN
ncbi:MAG: hypothetical protein HYU02_08850, partial [Thaumarchaeota archaeon]|nr:hypothetical protein [Nitrososphaerota archaeon]